MILHIHAGMGNSGHQVSTILELPVKTERWPADAEKPERDSGL